MAKPIEIFDAGLIKDKAKSAMDSARSLGQEATAKASNTVSIISTGAKDAIQAVDGFGKSIKDTLTESRNTIASKLAEAKSWLTDTDIFGLGSLNEMMAAAADAKKQAIELQNQISDTVSSGIGTIRGLTDDVMGVATDALYLLEQYPLDKITDGEYWLDIALGKNAEDINNLGNLTTRLLGQVEDIKTGYQDQYARLALAIGIADSAVTLGDSTVVDAIFDEFGNDVTLRETLILRFPDAVAQGNTALVKTIIKQFGADYVLIKYPDAVQIVLTSYRMPIGATSNDEPELAKELIDILESLDKDWDKVKTMQNAVHNVRVFLNASIGTQRTLRHVEEIGYLLKIAPNYSMSDPLSTARNVYPLGGFSY